MQTADQAKPMIFDAVTLHNAMTGVLGARALNTAVQLGLFTRIAEGHRSAADIAKASDCSERGVRMVLDCAVTMGVLTRDAGGYVLTPLASRYLVKTSDEYLGGMFESDQLWSDFAHLTESVRSGKPLHEVERKSDAESFFPSLVRNMHYMAWPCAERMAEALGASMREDARILDIGLGSAVWSIPFAQRFPRMKITGLDFPVMLEATKTYLAKYGVTDHYDFLVGDLNAVDMGENVYDLVILGNIAHSEGEESSQRLFARILRALRPGGRLAIIDMIPDDDRSGPSYPILWTLNMLLRTERGDSFTLAQYRAWLAGYSKVETLDIGSHSPLIVATA